MRQLDAWTMLDGIVDAIGTDETLEALARAMGTDELMDNLEYIARMYEIEINNEEDTLDD